MPDEMTKGIDVEGLKADLEEQISLKQDLETEVSKLEKAARRNEVERLRRESELKEQSEHFSVVGRALISEMTSVGIEHGKVVRNIAEINDMLNLVSSSK